MQEIKENTNKWKEISDSLVEIINVIKMSIRACIQEKVKLLKDTFHPK